METQKAIIFVILLLALLTPVYATVTSVTITSHAADDILAGNVTLTATVDSGDSPTSVTFYFQGDNIGDATDNGDSTWSLDFDTTAYTDGSGTLQVDSTDGTDTVSDSINIYIDNTAPTISNEAVSPNTSVSEFNPAEFTADFSDVALGNGYLAIFDSSDIMLVWANTDVGNDTNIVTDYSYSDSWDGTAYQVTDGTSSSDATAFVYENAIVITGMLDKENNGTEVEAFVIFDFDGNIIEYTDEITSGTSVFTPQLYDRSIDDLVDGDASFTLYDVGSESNPTLEIVKVASGDYNGVIEAVDVAGNYFDSPELTVTVDNDAPTIDSFTITKATPIEQGDSLTAADFNYTATDNYDSDLTANITGLDTSTVGTKTATLTVTDDAGNSATATLDYEVTDTTSPVISNISTSDIGETSAKVNWQTDEATNYTVSYGTDSANLSETLSAADFVSARSVDIASLSASTTYYYKITAADGSGNSAESAVQNFTTAAPPQPPQQEQKKSGGGGGGPTTNTSAIKGTSSTEAQQNTEAAGEQSLTYARQGEIVKGESVKEESLGDLVTGAFLGPDGNVDGGKAAVAAFFSLLTAAAAMLAKKFLLVS